MSSMGGVPRLSCLNRHGQEDVADISPVPVLGDLGDVAVFIMFRTLLLGEVSVSHIQSSPHGWHNKVRSNC
jgi:hypothetical protein